MTTHPPLQYGITVVIPALHEARTIEQTVRCCRACTDIQEIVVIDNGSLDETALRAEEAGATVLSVLPRNRSRARNAGLFRARYEYTLFLDAGVTFEPAAIEALLNRFHATPALVAAQGVLRSAGTKIHPEKEPQGLEEIDCFSHLGSRYTDTKALMVRTRIARDIAGFDECLKRTEDIDFGWRLTNAGLLFSCEPRALFWTPGATSLISACRRGIQTARALVTLHRKWYCFKPYSMFQVLVLFLFIGRRQIHHMQYRPRRERWCMLLDGIVTFCVYFMVRAWRQISPR